MSDKPPHPPPLLDDLTENDPITAALWRKIKEKELAHQQAIVYAKELSKEIVERRQVEAALRRSELNLKAILDNSAQSFFLIDKNYMIRTVNEVARRQSEIFLKKEIKIGQSILPLIDPAELADFRRNFTAALAGQSHKIEVSQAGYWFEYSYNPVLDERGEVVQVCFVAIDITERKRLEYQLAGIYELGQELTLLRQEEPIIKRVLEMVDKMLPFESAMCGLVDKPANELVYRYRLSQGQLEILSLPVSLLDELDEPGEANLGVAVVHFKQALTLADVPRPAAQEHHSVLCVPLKIRSAVIGVLMVERSPTHRFTPTDMQLLQVLADQAAVALENAHLYEEVQNQFVRLQQSQAQLIQVEKMAALGRLAASIAHEINNPLQSVRSCLTLVEEVLIGIQQNAQINRYLFIAGEEIERVAMIVSRMRDFYHPAQGIPQFDLPDSIEDIYYSIRGELREIDLHSVLESVLNLANKQLQQNEVEVRCSWTEDLPKLQGNLDYLKQVFLNLVLNAIDAMKATGGVLSINTTRSKFLLDYDAPQEAVCIEFRDSGVGMSPETQSRVFEPLFTTKEHGSGFGLYISYKIIEAHGGHIRVESDENLGTTIFITLPIIRPQETP
jgi:two-component system NtrC family sensor kinase